MSEVTFNARMKHNQRLVIQEVSNKRKREEFISMYIDYHERLKELGGTTYILAMDLLVQRDLRNNHVSIKVSDQSKSHKNMFYKRVNDLIRIGFMKRIGQNLYIINPEASPPYTKYYDSSWIEYSSL